MPNELTRLYRQMRGATAPSPEELIAVQRAEARRAMGEGMQTQPANLLEAVGGGLKRFAQGFGQRYQQAQVAAQKANPQGLPPTQMLRVDPEGIGLVPDIPPAMGALAATPLFRKASKMLELTPEVLQTIMESSSKSENALKSIHSVAWGLANKYVKKSGNTEAVALSLIDEGNQALTEAWLAAKKAGQFGSGGDPIVPYEDIGEFFQEAIYPRMQKIVNKLKAEENPLVPIATSKGEEVVHEGMEAARKGSSVLDRMGEAATQNVIPMVERGKLIPKTSLEERVVRKVLLQGDSPTRAMIDAGKGQYRTADSGKLIPTGDKQLYAEVPLGRVKEGFAKAGISTDMLKPSVLLQKKQLTDEQIMDAVDSVIDNASKNVNWNRYRKASYNYLIDGKSPQQVIRTLPGRNPYKRMDLAEERRAKRHLEAITSRVLEHFGIKRDVGQINSILRQLD